MNEENTQKRPETPNLDANTEISTAEVKKEATPEVSHETPTPENKSEVVAEVAKRLGGDVKVEEKTAETAPTPKSPNMIDINSLSQDQIQDLQELFASTPRRSKTKDTFHTIELRKIGDKIIVEWGKTYLTYRNDPTLRRDVMKTMIPVHFNGDVDEKGEKKFVDILWREEFMNAKMVVCRILKMTKEDDSEVVGTTLARDKDGGITSQEVEMYINKVIISLTVTLPDGTEATFDGSFAN